MRTFVLKWDLRKPALARRTPPLHCGKMSYRQDAAHCFGSLGLVWNHHGNNHAFNGQPCFTSVFLGSFYP